jgi:hypothetical protein
MRIKGTFAINAVRKHFPRLEGDEIAERLRLSTYVSLRHRYLYFEMPKAACSTLKDLILRAESCPDIPTDAYIAGKETRRDMGIHLREALTIPSLVDLDDETQRDVLESPSYFRLLVVRNPYARLVSAWRNKILVCEPGFEYIHERISGGVPPSHKKSLISFDAFIRFVTEEDLDTCNPHWRRQVSHSFFPAMNFSCIGQTEKLQDALSALQRHAGSGVGLQTRTINASGFQKDPAITAELADKIYDLYRLDFETFGYDRDSWRGGKSAAAVSEETFYDEVIERNIVISNLYDEIDRLKGELTRSYPFSLVRLWDALRRTDRLAAGATARGYSAGAKNH